MPAVTSAAIDDTEYLQRGAWQRSAVPDAGNAAFPRLARHRGAVWFCTGLRVFTTKVGGGTSVQRPVPPTEG